MKQNTNQTIERWGIRYTGIVQGVGFRPLVSMWAHSLGLTGFVYNDSQGVYVEIQGCTSDLQLFLDAIQDDQPRLCRITSQRVEHLTIQNNEVEFLKNYNRTSVGKNILLLIAQIVVLGIRLLNLYLMIVSELRWMSFLCVKLVRLNMRI